MKFLHFCMVRRMAIICICRYWMDSSCMITCDSNGRSFIPNNIEMELGVLGNWSVFYELVVCWQLYWCRSGHCLGDRLPLHCHHLYCHYCHDASSLLSSWQWYQQFSSRTRVIYYDLSREFKKIENAKVVFFSTIVTMIAGQYGSCPRYGGDVGGDRSPGIHQHPN